MLLERHQHKSTQVSFSPLAVLLLHLSRRGLKSTDDKYFSGKKRYTHLVMQGRFKHDVMASDLWTGHEWFQISNLVPTRCVGACNRHHKWALRSQLGKLQHQSHSAFSLRGGGVWACGKLCEVEGGRPGCMSGVTTGSSSSSRWWTQSTWTCKQQCGRSIRLVGVIRQAWRFAGRLTGAQQQHSSWSRSITSCPFNSTVRIL